MVILSAIHETTAAAVLTVVAADELASSSASGFSRAGAAAGTAGSTLSGEPTGELGWEMLPSSVSVSRELFSAFSTSSLSAEDLSADKVCPIERQVLLQMRRGVAGGTSGRVAAFLGRVAPLSAARPDHCAVAQPSFINSSMETRLMRRASRKQEASKPRAARTCRAPHSESWRCQGGRPPAQKNG